MGGWETLRCTSDDRIERALFARKFLGLVRQSSPGVVGAVFTNRGREPEEDRGSALGASRAKNPAVLEHSFMIHPRLGSGIHRFLVENNSFLRTTRSLRRVRWLARWISVPERRVGETGTSGGQGRRDSFRVTCPPTLGPAYDFPSSVDRYLAATAALPTPSFVGEPKRARPPRDEGDDRGPLCLADPTRGTPAERGAGEKCHRVVEWRRRWRRRRWRRRRRAPIYSRRRATRALSPRLSPLATTLARPPPPPPQLPPPLPPSPPPPPPPPLPPSPSPLLRQTAEREAPREHRTRDWRVFLPLPPPPQPQPRQLFTVHCSTGASRLSRAETTSGTGLGGGGDDDSASRRQRGSRLGTRGCVMRACSRVLFIGSHGNTSTVTVVVFSPRSRPRSRSRRRRRRRGCRRRRRRCRRESPATMRSRHARRDETEVPDTVDRARNTQRAPIRKGRPAASVELIAYVRVSFHAA